MSERVFLFGGTFDPVHHGHLIVARAVAEEIGAARITLVPAASPPHKPPADSSSDDRLAMLRLAVRDDPLFEICTLELNRSGPSYTIDTVEAILADRGPACRVSLVIGADTLDGVASWYRAEDLLGKVALVVARRPGAESAADVQAVLSRRLGPELAGRIEAASVATPLLDISSTEIRRRVAAGRSIRYLTPDSVLSYILDRGLYRPEARP
jgi:nicotinate-nucleotide adenylyltransferase